MDVKAQKQMKPNDVPNKDDEKKPQVAEKGAKIINDDANLQLQKIRSRS